MSYPSRLPRPPTVHLHPSNLAHVQTYLITGSHAQWQGVQQAQSVPTWNRVRVACTSSSLEPYTCRFFAIFDSITLRTAWWSVKPRRSFNVVYTLLLFMTCPATPKLIKKLSKSRMNKLADAEQSCDKKTFDLAPPVWPAPQCKPSGSIERNESVPSQCAAVISLNSVAYDTLHLQLLEGQILVQQDLHQWLPAHHAQQLVNLAINSKLHDKHIYVRHTYETLWHPIT